MREQRKVKQEENSKRKENQIKDGAGRKSVCCTLLKRLHYFSIFHPLIRFWALSLSRHISHLRQYRHRNTHYQMRHAQTHIHTGSLLWIQHVIWTGVINGILCTSEEMNQKIVQTLS